MFLFFPSLFLVFVLYFFVSCFLRFLLTLYWSATDLFKFSLVVRFFFPLSNFVFLPYFCNFAFFLNIFLCSINSDLNWCSLFISLHFSLYFSCFFFFFKFFGRVFFFFFFVEFLFVLNLLLFFLNFHLVCLLNVFHFL